MIYREFRPSPGLRPIVERLWCLEGPAETIAADPIPPDGHAELIVHAGDPFTEWTGDEVARRQERVLLAGQAMRAVRVGPSGFARVVGARFRPAGAHAFFRVPQRALTDRIVDLRDVDRRLARTLRDDVATRDDGADMIRAFDRALCRVVSAPASVAATRSPAQAAVAIAMRRRGLVRVSELTRLLDLSARQLERLFHERVGLPPKMFLRIIRFQEVLRAIRAGSAAHGWADVATAFGYYDQSHFIRDFKAFLGESPGAWQVSHESLTAVFSAIRRPPVAAAGPGASHEAGDDGDVAFFQDRSRELS